MAAGDVDVPTVEEIQPMPFQPPTRSARALLAALTLAVISLAAPPAARAVLDLDTASLIPLCGGRPEGNVCPLPVCGTVEPGLACVKPVCRQSPAPSDPPCVDVNTLPECSAALSPATPCRPPDLLLTCGQVPAAYLEFGYLCESTGPENPPCDNTLVAETYCQAADGNLCRVVAPGQFACLTVGGGGSACGALGPDLIVADCVAKQPRFVELTTAAVNGVLQDHQLPATDTGLVITYARDSVRAYLLASLVEVITKQDRTPEEEEIVAFYAARVRDLRVRQAEVSEAEYDIFQLNPCAYTPPPGFVTQFVQPPCGASLASLFATLSHPSFEEFKQYGIAAVAQADLFDDPEALRIASGTSSVSILFIAALAGAGLLAIGAWILLTVTGLGALIVSVVFPFATVPFTIGIFAGIAAGVGAGIIAVAGAVLAVLIFIAGTTFISIQYAQYDDFVRAVTNLVEDAQVMPDLRGELASGTEAVRKRAMMDLFHVYVKSTQPEWSPTGPPPASSLADPRFRVRDEQGNEIGIVRSIDLAVGDGGSAGTLALSTGLHRGWFRPTTRYRTEGGQTLEETSVRLGVGFVDWQGRNAVAWRRGTSFAMARKGANGEAVDPVVETELRYVDAAGNKRSASIVVDATPPVITPTVTGTKLNAGEWYASDVSLTWNVVDPETDATETSGCGPLTVSQDGVAEATCTASTTGGTASQKVVIKRDARKPTIARVALPEANEHGWRSTDVVVTSTCGDTGSGVAQCPAVLTLTEEGVGIVEAGVASDVAGNTATSESFLVSIDKTPPTIEIAVPSDGAVFILHEPVLSRWEASDALSGLRKVKSPVPSGSALDTSIAGDHALSVKAFDKAGHKTTAIHRFKVLTVAEGTARLAQAIEASDASLLVKRALQNALSPRAGGESVFMTLRLRAFTRLVDELAGKGITPEQAAQWTAEARKLLNAVQMERS